MPRRRRTDRLASRPRRRPGVLVAVAVLAAASLAGSPAGTGVASVAAATETPLRYLDPVFDEVTVTSDITYGSAVNHTGALQSLELDLYEPTGDEASERPLIVWMHGGSFAYGSKTGDFDREQGRELARRGFVVASLEYRLAAKPINASEFATSTGMNAIVDAYEDGRMAIAYLRDHAAEHRIDPDVVLASGYSAGGVTALNLAVLPYPPFGTGVDGDPGHVDGAIPYAGASLDRFVNPGEAPLLLFHGTADTVVPYSMAVDIHEAALAAGNESTLVAKTGATHDLSPYREELRERIGRWAYDRWLADAPTVHDLYPRTVDADTPTLLVVGGQALSPPGPTHLGEVPAESSVIDDGTRHVTTPAMAPGFPTVVVSTTRGQSSPTLWSWLAVADPNIASGPPPYPDIGPDHPFAAAISWAAGTTLTSGYDDGTFRAGAPVSRQALAVLVHRLSGSPGGPQPPCAVPPFSDVPADHPFCGAIAWASAAGVLTGHDDGTFRPGAPVSRQALAAVLHRVAALPDPAVGPSFSDVGLEHRFASAIAWLAEVGLVVGYPDGSFRPTAPVTRQAIVAVLHRHFVPPPSPAETPSS